MASTDPSQNPNLLSNPSLYLQDSEELTRVFNRFDTNADGKISADEFSAVMQVLGSDISPDEISRVMLQIDTDRDGFINLEDFTNFCKGGDGDYNADGGIMEVKEAFDLYDINNNGLISSSELYQILDRLGEKWTEEDCEKMIQTVDLDGDGYVNFEEFKLMMSNKTKG